MKHNHNIKFKQRRFKVIFIVLLIVMLAVVARMVYLTVFEQHFLRHQADVRMLRTVSLPAYRGMILSSDNVPLAMSIPVDAIWINPKDFPATYDNIRQVASILHISFDYLNRLIKRNKHRQFAYVKRDVKEALGEKIVKLALPGIYIERQFHRYYPEGSVTAHVVGFTNIDDHGQAGLELTYDNWLRGIPGKQQVLKDRLGHIVAVVDTSKVEKPGKDLQLSMNSRIQFLTNRVLKETVAQYSAESGSAIVMDPRNGEILAMANFPTYDPNKSHTPPFGRYRNRAVTDVFEPGSTMKAFSIASALESGRYEPNTEISTSPGYFKVGHNWVRDDLDNGLLTVSGVLQKSSNVGVAKMTLSLPADNLLALMQRVGFGQRTRSGYPGESAGILPDHAVWRPFDLATLAFGYGVSVTALQLIHAYSAIADQGQLCPVTFIKRTTTVACPQAIKPNIANEMLNMLQDVVKPGGTGTRAQIPGYSIAGKTGTAYIAGRHGYDKHHHVASFVGIAPASNPQLVVAMVVRNPQGKVHFGGVIAAPAFAKIMSGALRILNIPPDRLGDTKVTKVAPAPESD